VASGFAGRRKACSLILSSAPFGISYMMRMARHGSVIDCCRQRRREQGPEHWAANLNRPAGSKLAGRLGLHRSVLGPGSYGYISLLILGYTRGGLDTESTGHDSKPAAIITGGTWAGSAPFVHVTLPLSPGQAILTGIADHGAPHGSAPISPNQLLSGYFGDHECSGQTFD